MWNGNEDEERLKSKKFGNTRKDIRWKRFEVDIVVENVWRKGGELIGTEVHE